MSYHEPFDSLPFKIPPQPTEAETNAHRRYGAWLEKHALANRPVTREQALYMLNTLPIVGCFGGYVPPFPDAAKAFVESAAPGAIIPTVHVAAIFKAWRP